MKSSQSREEEDVKVERRGKKLGTLEEPSFPLHLTSASQPSTHITKNLKFLKALKEKHDIECLTKMLGGEDTPGKKKCKGPRNTRYVSKEGFDERKSLPIPATSEGNAALN
ncbi:hypothetical protein Tco_0965405 [Tanacetum coccineum]